MVRSKVGSKLFAAVLIASAVVNNAMAQTATFSSTTATDSLSDGVDTAVTIVGPLVALAAAIMVWKKVRKYFGKAD